MQDQIKELSLLLLNDWQNLEIHDVEEKVFRMLLTVGKKALSAYIEKKGTGENAYGNTIQKHTIKKWDYISIFGTIPVQRAYFWKEGKGSGVFPIADELNLPGKHYSYLLKNWNQLLAVDSNFDRARETLKKILGINLWTKQSEEINQHTADFVNEFYKLFPVTTHYPTQPGHFAASYQPEMPVKNKRHFQQTTAGNANSNSTG